MINCKIIEEALKEDIGNGDITANSIIPEEAVSNAEFVCKENGIIAGLEIVKKIYPSARLLARDGEAIRKGQIVAEVKGKTREILSRERVALNFLQRLSGIATITGKFVNVAGSVKVLDTRKTTPCMRELEKYAVRMGGGYNHRMGLYDMILIKDNHIKAAGGIRKAVEFARKVFKPTKASEFKNKVEIEVENLEQLKEAIGAGPDIIMLDNMSISAMKEAIKLVDGRFPLEVSGNVTLERMPEIAKLGVDFVSVGAITHSAKALNISMEIHEKD